MQKLETLEMGNYYHIFNRGVNKENIFKNPGNYPYFLSKYYHYITPVADTFAYCLLRNHFHLLIRIKKNIIIDGDPDLFCEWDFKDRLAYVSQQFSHFFNCYAQAINKQNLRTGGLFQHRFKRVLVKDEFQFDNLIWYIHSNALKHRFVKDFNQYPYSSYPQLIGRNDTWLMKEELFDRFGGRGAFIEHHEQQQKYYKALANFDDSFEIKLGN